MQWGPIYWKFIHGLVKHNYKKQHHDRIVFIMNSLAFLLPCSICRSNYLLKLIHSPVPQEQSQQTMQRWLVDLHNNVNRDLGKPLWSYRQAALSVSSVASKHVHEALKMFILITQYNIQYNVKNKAHKKDMQILFANVKDHLKIMFPRVQFTALHSEARCKRVRAMRV